MQAKETPPMLACAKALHEGDINAARAAYKKIESSQNALHLAIGGRMYMAAGEMAKAEEHFEAARDRAFVSGDNSTTRYIFAFVQIMIKYLRGESGIEEPLGRALEARPHIQLFLCLPLFRPEDNPEFFLQMFPEEEEANPQPPRTP